MDAADRDRFVRLAAFQWLKREIDQRGEVLSIAVLREGFSLDGQRVPLMGPQGIFKPVPVVEGRFRPYDDEVGPDGFLRYRYRGTDPLHHDNVGLRWAMERQLPLVYLNGTAPGWYRPEWPVFIVNDDPDVSRPLLTTPSPAGWTSGRMWRCVQELDGDGGGRRHSSRGTRLVPAGGTRTGGGAGGPDA